MNKKLILIFFFAFLFRIFLIPVAHHGDLNNNISWGQELISRGFDGYYGSPDANDWPYSAPNQPPLYILLFGGAVSVYDLVDSSSRYLNESVGVFPSSFIWYWETSGMDLLVKLPGILADIGIAYLVYLYFKKKKEEKLGVKIAILWLLNPVIWYNSSVWGQTDSLVNLIGLVAVFGLIGVFGELEKIGRLGWFGIWFTLSVLFKGSLLIFLPILAILIIRQGFELKDYVKTILYSLFTILLVSVWFHPHIDSPIWIYELYTRRILPGEIGYLTANAFNFWWLVDPGKVLDGTLYLDLPARIWGLVGTVGGIGGVGYWFSKGKFKSKRLFLSLALSALITFLFMTRIHERYLYPFFPYATLLVGLIPSFWIPYILLSLIHLLNLYHLFWAPSIPFLKVLYLNPIFPQMISLLTIVSFIYLLRHLRESKI